MSFSPVCLAAEDYKPQIEHETVVVRALSVRGWTSEGSTRYRTGWILRPPRRHLYMVLLHECVSDAGGSLASCAVYHGNSELVVAVRGLDNIKKGTPLVRLVPVRLAK